jgi:hypothetical protein
MPKNRPKPVLITTTGVEVLVHGVDYTDPEEDAQAMARASERPAALRASLPDKARGPRK